MTFRLIFRDPGVWEFQKGALFDLEKDAISACIRWHHEYPDRDYGYIWEEST